MPLRNTRFRSRLEQRVAKRLSTKWEYESESFDYISHHTYNPDFSSNGVHLEVKGRFRTSGEARKYISVRESNPGICLIFIFQSASTPMPGAKRRRDGTKLTMSEWATKNEFLWTTEDEVNDEILKTLIQAGHTGRPVEEVCGQACTQVQRRSKVLNKAKRKVGQKTTKSKRSR